MFFLQSGQWANRVPVSKKEPSEQVILMCMRVDQPGLVDKGVFAAGNIYRNPTTVNPVKHAGF
jgi:hypothetical protein